MLLSAVPIVTPALAFTCYDLVRYIWSPEHGLEQGSSQVSKPRFRGKCCTANATRLRKNITTLEVLPHWEIEDLMCRARLGVERDLLRASVSRRSSSTSFVEASLCSPLKMRTPSIWWNAV